MKPQNLGALGEKLALNYLQQKKYKLIKKNFRSSFGEIDLIVEKNEILVFVEIKTRFSQNYGPPETAVTPRKIRSIIKTGQFFLLKNDWEDKAIRIDVVAIDYDCRKKRVLSIKHFKNVTM